MIIDTPLFRETYTMNRSRVNLMMAIFLTAFSAAVLSCATDQAPLPIENSLPQSEIAYYNDSFDKMREDLWDRAGYLYREEQVKNFKQAELRFENGRLIIRTLPGSFSKGGLSSKYSLRGDFDIQLQCRMDFLKDLSGMDQLLTIGAYDKDLKIGKISAVIIGLSMEGGFNQAYLFSNCFVNGSRKKRTSQKTEYFNGAFRFVRTGKTIGTLYKKAGALEWNKMLTFQVTDKDMIIGLQVRNFFNKRTIIRADHSISAEFDSFTINAAQEIIEEEI